jgi:S-adenosylhomocysteine hydrolase
MSGSSFKDYPAIVSVVDQLDIGGRAPFRGYEVLAVQHIHSSMAMLVDALCLGGAEPEHMTVAGKSYSTQPEAVTALRERGVHVVDAGRMRDPGRCYELEHSDEIAAALDGLQERTGGARPLLVLDDGAVTARHVARRPELARRCRVVEQTTRGARWADVTSVGFPVVDVARSAAKAEFEAPLIARCLAEGLDLALEQVGGAPRILGIVGYGRIGARLADLLGRRFDVLVHDADQGRAAAARADGLQLAADLPALLGAVDVLVGCTGNAILGEADLRQLTRPMILASGASSDLEFALWPRRRPEAMLAGSKDALRPWHNHYAIDRDAGCTLLAGGFPLNFFLPGEHLTPAEFQLTRALMLAGAAQVVGERGSGLIPLDPHVQSAVTAAYAAVTATAYE